MPARTTRSGANQESVRRHNLSTLLRHLHLSGRSSRSSLTTLMGLNRSTIADLVVELELLGLVAQQKPDTRGRAAGRPSVRVVATDPGSVKDFEAFAKQTGNPLLESGVEEGKFVFLLKKA